LLAERGQQPVLGRDVGRGDGIEQGTARFGQADQVRVQILAARNLTERRRSGLPLWLMVTAQFVVILDFSIVNVALPTIQRVLGW